MRKLNFVMQPTPDSCTSACLAMITGIPVDTVISEFHNAWKAHEKECNPSTYLASKGVDHKPSGGTFSNLAQWDKVYLLTVASPNIAGGLHHIVLDLRKDQEKVLDPNKGRKDKKYYIGWAENSDDPLAVRLSAWIIDLEVTELSEAKE